METDAVNYHKQTIFVLRDVQGSVISEFEKKVDRSYSIMLPGSCRFQTLWIVFKKKQKKNNILGAERCHQPLLNASFYIENGSWKNWFNICEIYFTKYINIPWTVHCILMHIKYYMSYCFVWLFVSVCMFFVLLYFDFSFDLLYCDRIRIAALLGNFLGHGCFVFFLLVICRTNYIYHFAPS